MKSNPFSSSIIRSVDPCDFAKLQAHNDLTSFPSFTSIQALPSINRSNLYANHVLITILWFIITHSLGLLNPRVPNDNIREVITNDIKSRTSGGNNRSCVLWKFLLHSVDFT